MTDQEKKASQKRKLRLAVLLFAGIALCAFTVVATLWVLKLKDPAEMERFQSAIESMGAGGWLVLLAIQYFQIVVAFVPGGPIQLVAGALFGPLGGIAVCFTGTLLATATVFALVKRYGDRVVGLFVEDKEIKEYSFLQNDKKIERLAAVLFLIPGTPKDALTYLFALTPIKMGRFLLISTLARLPAVLTSVFAGDRMVQGEWLQAGLLFVAICLLGLGGLLAHRSIMKHMHKKNQ